MDVIDINGYISPPVKKVLSFAFLSDITLLCFFVKTPQLYLPRLLGSVFTSFSTIAWSAIYAIGVVEPAALRQGN